MAFPGELSSHNLSMTLPEVADDTSADTQGVACESPFISHLGAQFHSNNNSVSDIKVFCNETLYLLHKVIVCAVSPWFSKACEEARTKKLKNIEDIFSLKILKIKPRITIADVTRIAREMLKETDSIYLDLDVDVAYWMFHFIYHGTYAVTGKFEATVKTRLTFHIKMIEAAENYEVEELKEEACAHYENECKSAVTNWPAELIDALCATIPLVKATQGDNVDMFDELHCRSIRMFLQTSVDPDRVGPIRKLLDDNPDFRTKYLKSCPERIRKRRKLDEHGASMYLDCDVEQTPEETPPWLSLHY